MCISGAPSPATRHTGESVRRFDTRTSEISSPMISFMAVINAVMSSLVSSGAASLPSSFLSSKLMSPWVTDLKVFPW